MTTPRSDQALREAVAEALSTLTGPRGIAATDSRRSTRQHYEDDPRRALVRKRIITDYLDHTHPTCDWRTAVITAGVPGAGKSTAVDGVLGAEAPSFRHLDPDRIKDDLLDDALASGLFDDLLSIDLPDGRPVAPRELATLVHEESTMVCDQVRRACLVRGERIIIDGTLTWPPQGPRLAAELRDAGYRELRIIAVEVPEAVAQHRAAERWWSVRSANSDRLGGRFTPPAIISSAYQPDGQSLCLTNAFNLAAVLEGIAGMHVTLEVIDAIGTITRR